MALVFGLVFVFAAFLTALGSAPGTGELNWTTAGSLAAFFASLGALYGCVVALDERSEMAIGSHPAWRVTLSAGFGATTVLVVWSWNPSNFDLMWTVAGAAVGGVLGWYGWRWARYVDF